MDKINYLEIDKECIVLCKTLNAIKGIRTLGSCSGHGKTDFYIYFSCSYSRRLMPIVDFVYEFEWNLQSGLYYNYNTHNRYVNFMLSSNDKTGEEAYKEALILNERLKKYFKLDM